MVEQSKRQNIKRFGSFRPSMEKITDFNAFTYEGKARGTSKSAFMNKTKISKPEANDLMNKTVHTDRGRGRNSETIS